MTHVTLACNRTFCSVISVHFISVVVLSSQGVPKNIMVSLASLDPVFFLTDLATRNLPYLPQPLRCYRHHPIRLDLM